MNGWMDGTGVGGTYFLGSGDRTAVGNARVSYAVTNSQYGAGHFTANLAGKLKGEEHFALPLHIGSSSFVFC